MPIAALKNRGENMGDALLAYLTFAIVFAVVCLQALRILEKKYDLGLINELLEEKE